MSSPTVLVVSEGPARALLDAVQRAGMRAAVVSLERAIAGCERELPSLIVLDGARAAAMAPGLRAAGGVPLVAVLADVPARAAVNVDVTIAAPVDAGTLAALLVRLSDDGPPAAPLDGQLDGARGAAPSRLESVLATDGGSPDEDPRGDGGPRAAALDRGARLRHSAVPADPPARLATEVLDAAGEPHPRAPDSVRLDGVAPRAPTRTPPTGVRIDDAGSARARAPTGAAPTGVPIDSSERAETRAPMRTAPVGGTPPAGARAGKSAASARAPGSGAVAGDAPRDDDVRERSDAGAAARAPLEREAHPWPRSRLPSEARDTPGVESGGVGGVGGSHARPSAPMRPPAKEHPSSAAAVAPSTRSPAEAREERSPSRRPERAAGAPASAAADSPDQAVAQPETPAGASDELETSVGASDEPETSVGASDEPETPAGALDEPVDERADSSDEPVDEPESPADTSEELVGQPEPRLAALDDAVAESEAAVAALDDAVAELESSPLAAPDDLLDDIDLDALGVDTLPDIELELDLALEVPGDSPSGAIERGGPASSLSPPPAASPTPASFDELPADAPLARLAAARQPTPAVGTPLPVDDPASPARALDSPSAAHPHVRDDAAHGSPFFASSGAQPLAEPEARDRAVAERAPGPATDGYERSAASPSRRASVAAARGAERPLLPPDAADVPSSGRLDEPGGLTLVGLVGVLHRRRHTGRLTIELGGARRSLLFDDGSLVGADSELPADSLLERLHRAARLTRSDRDHAAVALAAAPPPPTPSTPAPPHPPSSSPARTLEPSSSPAPALAPSSSPAPALAPSPSPALPAVSPPSLAARVSEPPVASAAAGALAVAEGLVALGLVEGDEVPALLAAHVEELVYACFGWECARYTLTAAPPPAAERVRLPHPYAVAAEGVRRKHGLERLAEVVGPEGTLLRPLPALAAVAAAADLAAPELDAAHALESAPCTVAELRARGLGTHLAYALAHILVELGGARIERPPARAPVLARRQVEAKEEQIAVADPRAILGVDADASPRELRLARERAHREFALERVPAGVAPVRLGRILAAVDRAYRTLARTDR